MLFVSLLLLAVLTTLAAGTEASAEAHDIIPAALLARLRSVEKSFKAESERLDGLERLAIDMQAKKIIDHGTRRAAAQAHAAEAREVAGQLARHAEDYISIANDQVLRHKLRSPHEAELLPKGEKSTNRTNRPLGITKQVHTPQPETYIGKRGKRKLTAAGKQKLQRQQQDEMQQIVHRKEKIDKQTGQALSGLVQDGVQAERLAESVAMRAMSVMALLQCDRDGCSNEAVGKCCSCSGCQLTTYCSAKCKKQDRKTHKPICKAIKAREVAEKRFFDKAIADAGLRVTWASDYQSGEFQELLGKHQRGVPVLKRMLLRKGVPEQDLVPGKIIDYTDPRTKRRGRHMVRKQFIGEEGTPYEGCHMVRLDFPEQAGGNDLTRMDIFGAQRRSGNRELFANWPMSSVVLFHRDNVKNYTGIEDLEMEDHMLRRWIEGEIQTCKECGRTVEEAMNHGNGFTRSRGFTTCPSCGNHLCQVCWLKHATCPECGSEHERLSVTVSF